MARRSRTATFQRSLELFRAFRTEQSDPAGFYCALASDSSLLVSQVADLKGARVLDIGGGPGYFRDAFRARGATYWSVEVDAGEMSGLGIPGSGMVQASGLALPFCDGAVDVSFSSNVLEHVRDPERFADEMVRVTRRGGVAVLSYTPWLSPWGGHETSPWHYFGGRRAGRRYEHVHGCKPKNQFGTSLFRVSAGQMLRWVDRSPDIELVDVFPRYHPWWAQWVIRVPLVREVASWNVVMVLRRR